MKVRLLTFDPSSSGFTVFLSDLEDKHALPIQIGPFEANAIALRLKKVMLQRPMTHDLLRNILTVFNSRIMKIEVTDLMENTYYAVIYIKADGKELTIDSRPSDAIALALGAGAPIYVSEEVLSKAKSLSSDELEEWLKSLKLKDFKYQV